MIKSLAMLLSVLLASALGCTSEDALPSTATITDAGSFRLEGHVVNCEASATSGSIVSSTDSLESISIQLNDTTTKSGELRYFSLDFQRSADQPNAPYQLELAMYASAHDKPVVFYENVVATLRETSPGVVSGTFTNGKPGQSTVNEGSFTNVHVRPPANQY